MPAPTLVNYSASTTAAGSGTSYTASFTVTNNNALVVVFVNTLHQATSPSDRWITGVTIGGASAIEACHIKQTSTNRRYATGIYWLSGVSSGSKSIVVNVSDTFTQYALYTVELSGYDTGNPIRQADGNLLGVTATSASISVTTDHTESLWLGTCRTQDGDKVLAPQSGVTELHESRTHATNDWAIVANLLTRSGAGTYNIGSTWSGAIAGGGVAVAEIAPFVATTGKPHIYYHMMNAS